MSCAHGCHVRGKVLCFFSTGLPTVSAMLPPFQDGTIGISTVPDTLKQEEGFVAQAVFLACHAISDLVSKCVQKRP